MILAVISDILARSSGLKLRDILADGGGGENLAIWGEQNGAACGGLFLPLFPVFNLSFQPIGIFEPYYAGFG